MTEYCNKCKRKIKISSKFDCKCGKVFCAAHRYPNAHECSFNHKEKWIEKMKIICPKVIADKIKDKI